MLSKVTICVFLAFVFFSIMLTKIQNTIKIDEDKVTAQNFASQDENTKVINKPWPKFHDVRDRRAAEDAGQAPPGAEFKHLMTFVQVSMF